LLIVCWTGVLFCQSTESQASRQKRWEQDIDAFVRAFSAGVGARDPLGNLETRGQVDFERFYPPRQFKAEIAALKQSVSARSDAEMVLELSRIVANAHIAHTNVEIPRSMGFERVLPVQFRWFSDSMIVWLATPDYKQTIGLRVVKVGSMTPEELEKAVAQFISFENDVWLRWNSTAVMTMQPVLQMLRLIDADGCVRLTLSGRGEKELTIKLPFAENQRAWIGVFAALQIPFPMNFRQKDRNYWYRYLEDSQTAYVNFGNCVDDPRQPFADFVRAMMKDLDMKPVRRVVVDLMRNGGGNSDVIHPLMDALKAHRQWKGQIFVLIGPETFSAAVMAALRMKDELHATLVGEAAGGKPGFYGFPGFVTLPNSQLVIRFTTKYTPAPAGMDRPVLIPDIPASMSTADLFAGRDPALDAAIAAR
jgi:hypothetical protein